MKKSQKQIIKDFMKWLKEKKGVDFVEYDCYENAISVDYLLEDFLTEYSGGKVE